MKILFVQHMGAISGSELYLMQLLPELKKRGYDVEVLIAFKINSGKNKPLVDKLAANGIQTHEIYGHDPFSIKLLSKIKRIVREGKYDLVQSNLIHADLWMAAVKFFFSRKMKLLSVKHGFNEEYAARHGFNTKKVNRVPSVWVQRLSGIMTNRNVTVSRGVYELYVKGRITKPSKISVVYLGLNLDFIKTEGYSNKNTRRYAIILGRIVKYKGHELVIKAWKKVKEYDPSLQLFIVGDGPYRETLVKLVADLDLTGQVRFCGYQPNPHELLHFSEFAVVSSVFEGFGLITLETWYHKKPVIAFDVPAFNELINDGENGLIVTPFDTNELGDKMIRLFKDPATGDRMGENGHNKLMKEYTVERMADEMEEIYKSI